MSKFRLFAMISFLLLLTACNAAPSLSDAPTTSSMPQTTTTLDYTTLFPPRLAKDFYPDGLTREALLNRLPGAVEKTGTIMENETWEGVIRITGDLRIPLGVSVTVKPGTVIFIAAGSDDQHSGGAAPKDLYNPKVPVRDAAYSQSRIEFLVDGAFVAKGTREQPIIITSDADAPQTDDWLGLQFSPGSTGELERVIVEYCRIIGVSSGDVIFKQSIIRNIMCTIVIMGEGEELLTVSPTITESYIYNTGQLSITVRSGAPTISYNVIYPRQDLDLNLPGFEYGAVGVDHPAQPSIHHNFLEGGGPIRYDEYDNSGNYHEYIYGTCLGFHGSIAPLTIAYNTFYNGSNTGLEVFPSPVTIEYNNFVNNASNLQVQESLFEPSDAWQQQLFEEGVLNPLRAEVIQAINNFWGTVSLDDIKNSVHPNSLVEVVLEPIKTEFIEEALPSWDIIGW